MLEAAIAAVYLEHGFERIEPAIVAAFSEKIEYARSSHVDYKTELQEALARSGRQVHYTVLEVEGPPHDRRFVCAAHVAGAQLGIGRGSTKKAAEQEAARQALEALGVVPDDLEPQSRPSGRDRGPAGVTPGRTSCDRPVVARIRAVHLRTLRIRGFKSFPDPSRSRSSRASPSSSARTARASRTSPTRSSGRRGR